jgi:hypothetical protein
MAGVFIGHGSMRTHFIVCFFLKPLYLNHIEYSKHSVHIDEMLAVLCVFYYASIVYVVQKGG